MRPWATRSDERSAGGSIISPRLHSHLLDSSQILPRVEKRAFWNTIEDMLVSYFFSCLSFWASLTQVFTLSFFFLFFVFCFFVFCFLFFVFSLFFFYWGKYWSMGTEGKVTTSTVLVTFFRLQLIMVIGPSGVQFGLWSYKWLSKSSICLSRVRLLTGLDDINSCYKLITVTISGKKYI